MNKGLLIKAARETFAVTLLCGLGLMVFEMLLMYVLSSFLGQLAGEWLKIDFIQNMLRGLLGSEIGVNIGPGALRSIVWVHPVILALMWAHEITLCTRMPAGEVDRGTIDVLFGLPVSRWQVYLHETLVWVASGIAIIFMGVFGNLLGGLMVGAPPVDPSQLVMVVVNLYGLYLAVGGLALLTATLSDRRGRAVAVTLGIVLASFLLNFLAQFSSVAKSISFLSLLHYYRPLLILQNSAWPISDMRALVGCGTLLWLAGGLVFARRDICTV